MASVADNGKKWIQSSVAIACMILGYVLIQFFQTLDEWFQLESMVSNFSAVSQVLAVLIALASFIYVMKNARTSTFLNEVFHETQKVVWPDKNATVRHTVGIMIGVTIVGVILGLFDISASWFLSLVN